MCLSQIPNGMRTWELRLFRRLSPALVVTARRRPLAAWFRSRAALQVESPPVFFPKIIVGVPLLLAPPDGPANQPESDRIEGPAPGRRTAAETAVTGAASRKVE